MVRKVIVILISKLTNPQGKRKKAAKKPGAPKKVIAIDTHRVSYVTDDGP
jgi:hypothetical protein